MKPDFHQKSYLVMGVFVSMFAALLLPLIYKQEKVFMLFVLGLIAVFSFVLYKIVPGDKK